MTDHFLMYGGSRASTSYAEEVTDILNAELTYTSDVLHHCRMTSSKISIELSVETFQWVVGSVEDRLCHITVLSSVNVPIFRIILNHSSFNEVLPEHVEFRFKLPFI